MLTENKYNNNSKVSGISEAFLKINYNGEKSVLKLVKKIKEKFDAESQKEN